MATKGTVSGVIANMVTLVVDGPVAQNEICYISTGGDKLMAAVSYTHLHWSVTDADARKCGYQTGLDTLVVHTVNDEYSLFAIYLSLIHI